MKHAFTLSEVLITIGIIGVVSAITLPVLIANIQQQTLNNRWKKAYSDINQAYALVQAEEDLTSYYNCSENYCFIPVVNKILEKFKGIRRNTGYLNYKNISEQTSIPRYKTILGENIDVSHMFTSEGAYYMNDMLIYIWTYHPKGAAIWVDVNGFKKPNTIGKDLFAMQITGNTITPFGRYGTGDWCKGYGSRIDDLAKQYYKIYLQNNATKYYAGIGCSYEVLYGKRH